MRWKRKTKAAQGAGSSPDRCSLHWQRWWEDCRRGGEFLCNSYFLKQMQRGPACKRRSVADYYQQ